MRHTPSTCPSYLTWTLLALLLVPASLLAWPGHEWDRWREVTTWSRPTIQTGQEGRSDLLPLLHQPSADSSDRITSTEQWETRREELLDAFLAILGTPTELRRLDLEVEVLGEETVEMDQHKHVRRHLRIRSEADDWIPAYLLLPDPLPEGKLPTMICLHQTVPWGKREPCGMEGDRELAFALELVQRGFVCIAPDAIGFGERIPAGTQPYHDSIEFYKRHPNWSFVGKMNWDIARVIDYLETLPFVDTERIGSIGHSHGAYGTLFASAVEPRISAAIASCGFTTLRTDPSPHRWSHATALIPQLGFYLPEVADIPFDWHHICAFTAPRSLYIFYATEDRIFPGTDNLEEVLSDVRSVYRLGDREDRVAWGVHEGDHKFPTAARQTAYEWLEQQMIAPNSPP